MAFILKDITTPIHQVRKTESVVVVGAPARFTANPAGTSAEGKVLQTAITGPPGRFEKPLPVNQDGVRVSRVPDSMRYRTPL